MHRLKRPSPSMAVALLALVIALGGTATAATVIVKSSSDIKNGAVSRQDIAKSAVNSGRVQDGSLKADDLNGATRAALESASTEALEAFRVAGPEDVPAGQKATVATLRNVPAGAYAIFAKTVLTAPDNDSGVLSAGQAVAGSCTLDAGGDTDRSVTLLGSPGAIAPGGITTQLTKGFISTGTIELECDVNTEAWRASDTSIIALRLDSAPRQRVND